MLLQKEKSKLMIFVEKRLSRRMPTSFDARFFYGNLFYSGTVLNISEKGMFIRTRRCLDPDTMFVIIIRGEQEILKMVAKVKRTTHDPQACNGMGIELMSPSDDYIAFFNKLAAV